MALDLLNRHRLLPLTQSGIIWAGLPMKVQSNSSRPSVGLVLLSVGPVSALEEALSAVLPSCRTYGVTLLVARVPGPADGLLPVAAGSGVEVFIAAEGTSEADLRRMAISRLTADIVTFVQDSRASEFPWADLLLERGGLVRHSVHPPAGTGRAAAGPEA